MTNIDRLSSKMAPRPPWIKKVTTYVTTASDDASLTRANVTAFIVEKIDPSKEDRRRTEDRVRKLVAWAIDRNALQARSDGRFDRDAVTTWAQSKASLKTAFPYRGGGGHATMPPLQAKAAGFEDPATIAACLTALGQEREQRLRLQSENEHLRVEVAGLLFLKDAALERSKKASLAGQKGRGVPRRRRG